MITKFVEKNPIKLFYFTRILVSGFLWSEIYFKEVKSAIFGIPMLGFWQIPNS